MALALTSASRLKPEIRLAQAISEFEASLTDDQKNDMRSYKTESPPDSVDVMRLTARIDRENSHRAGRRCFGPRLTSILESVQQFTSVVDTVVSGSQSIIASSIWGTLKLALLVASNFASYFDRLSTLLMNVGRACPRYKEFGFLYPTSVRLQHALCDYYVEVVRLCSKAVSILREPFYSQLSYSATRHFQSNFGHFESELQKIARVVYEESCLASLQEQKTEINENALFRTFTTKFSDKMSLEFLEAKRRRSRKAKSRFLETCSTYNHQKAWKHARKAGATDWIRDHDEYKKWLRSSTSATLWCTGILGSGKTVLSANLVEHTLISVSGAGFSYFFCRHDDQESLKASTIIASLVRQLLDCVSPEKFDDLEKESPDPHDIDQLLNVLLKILPLKMSGYYIMLDGLDECDAEDLDVLVQKLKILPFSKHSFHVYLSSRQELYRKYLKTLRPQHFVSMTDGVSEIEDYIASSLYDRLQSESLSLGDPTIISAIQDALVKGSQGMFLWVVYQIDAICLEATDEDILSSLQSLPKDLPETFNRILRRIHQRGAIAPEFCKRIFEITAAARRPLTLNELRHAMGVVPGTTLKDASKLVNNMQREIDSCGGLLHVDEEQRSVHFAHHSIIQHLTSPPTDSYVTKYHLCLPEADVKLGEICVTYLISDTMSTRMVKLETPNQSSDLPLIDIPSTVIKGTLPRSLSSKVALRLLRRRAGTTFDAFSQLKANIPLRDDFTNDSLLESAFLSYAENNWLLHTRDFSPLTKSYPMWTRLIKGEKRNLAFPWDPETFTDLGQNLIAWSIFHSHKPLLSRILLESSRSGNDVEFVTLVNRFAHQGDSLPNFMSYYNTALDISIKLGLKKNLSCSLKWCTGLDGMEDVFGRALFLSVENNSRETTGLILLHPRRGTVNVENKVGVIQLAMNKMQEDMIRLLLGYWKDAIFGAVKAGYSAQAMRLLLQCMETDIHTLTDEDGKTLLWWTVCMGQNEVFEVILLRAADEIRRVDKKNGDFLSSASDEGRERLARLISERPMTDKTTPWHSHTPYVDEKGRTALWYAAKNGMVEVVNVLLSTHRLIDTNLKDSAGQKPLSVAVQSEAFEVVKCLIKQRGTDCSMVKSGKTPRWYNPYDNNLELLRLLLSHKHTDVTLKDWHGQNLLLVAVELGFYIVAKLLLEEPETDPNLLYRMSVTPLRCAINNGSTVMVKMILKHERTDPNVTSLVGETPLSAAVEGSYHAIIELLLRHPEIDPNGRDVGAPLWLATRKGDEQSVKMLLSHHRTNVNLRDLDGRTPLTMAVLNEATACITALLRHPNIDPNLGDKHGRTPLWYAADNGSGIVVSLLLNRMDVKVSTGDVYDQTPLSRARIHRHHAIIHLLQQRES